ncbi:PIF1-like helicase-domain-containing protein, partial [Fomitopsis betulina]
MSKTKANVSRHPGAVHKSFKSLSQAQEWLKDCNTTDRTSTLPARDVLPDATSDAVADALKNMTLTPDIVLSPEQQAVLDMVKAGRNVFFTGSAGTGKSVLLREIIQHCGGRGADTLAITAATGIASVNIGGCTLHSWAGVGIGKETKDQLLGRLLGYDKHLRHKAMASDGQTTQNRVVARWRRVKTLIVDEISMIDGDLFDKLVRGTVDTDICIIMKFMTGIS